MDFINQVIVLNELEAAEIAAERNPRHIFQERDPFELSDDKFIKPGKKFFVYIHAKLNIIVQNYI